MTYEQYVEIRSDYISENPNLWIFEISAPRGFGEKFAQTYVQGKCVKLQRPSKKIDPDYSNQYDLWLDGITIEVKASRAVDSDSDEPLYKKADPEIFRISLLSLLNANLITGGFTFVDQPFLFGLLIYLVNIIPNSLITLEILINKVLGFQRRNL